MLLIVFPELKKKQASILFYYWQKITKEKYEIEPKKDEENLISHLFNNIYLM